MSQSLLRRRDIVVHYRANGFDLFFGAGGEPFSRQGAEAEFTKLVLNARYDAAIDTNWRLGLSGRVQSSFGDPLVTSEQMNVAGSGELSAFDAGSLRGDSGWTVRAELGHQSQVDFSDVTNPYTPPPSKSTPSPSSYEEDDYYDEASAPKFEPPPAPQEDTADKS